MATVLPDNVKIVEVEVLPTGGDASHQTINVKAQGLDGFNTIPFNATIESLLVADASTRQEAILVAVVAAATAAGL